MKIVNQNINEMFLKEGNTPCILFGLLFIIVGSGVLLLAHSLPIIPTLILLLFIIIGLAVIFLTSSIEIKINKITGNITYINKRLVGANTKLYLISDIIGIQTYKNWARDSHGRTLLFRSVFVFKDGSQLPIDHPKSSGNSIAVLGLTKPLIDMNSSAYVGNQIAVFMNIPFKEDSVNF